MSYRKSTKYCPHYLGCECLEQDESEMHNMNWDNEHYVEPGWIWDKTTKSWKQIEPIESDPTENDLDFESDPKMMMNYLQMTISIMTSVQILKFKIQEQHLLSV